MEKLSGSLFISQQRGPEVVASTMALTSVIAGAFATGFATAFNGAFLGAFERVVVMTRDASPTRAALASGPACASVAAR